MHVAAPGHAHSNLTVRSVSESGDQRASSFTGMARRQQIVSGAIAVLAEKGFSATSLAAIAEHLDVSKGVISYHFAGKTEVLHEVVRTVLGQAEAWMTPRVAEATSFTDALHSYIWSNMAFLDTHRDEIFALTEVLANMRAAPGVAETFGESQRGAVAALEALFTGGEKAGEFDAVSARVAAISLRAAIDSVSTLMRDEPHFDVMAFGTELAALFERVVARGPGGVDER